MFGFPFEVLTNATRRQQAMGRILDIFNVAAPVAAVDVKTRVNGLDADTPTGPVLISGSTVTFTYVVTNAGNVPLSSITVKDNNGTPGNTADDFNATYTSGDTNSNGQIDVGETWTFTAQRTVAVGQYATTGTVTATGNAQSISDTDLAHYFGIIPANADFNGDTIVDTGDYILWRRNSGVTSGATHGQGDANYDGAVNDADYMIWRSQYGMTIEAGGGGQGVAGVAASGAALPAEAASLAAPASASAGGASLQAEARGDEQESAARRAAFAALSRDWGARPAVGSARAQVLHRVLSSDAKAELLSACLLMSRPSKLVEADLQNVWEQRIANVSASEDDGDQASDADRPFEGAGFYALAQAIV
jgi:hypothetical protein